MAKRALGRGLEAILGEVEEAYSKELNRRTTNEIDIDKISPNPLQPRKHFDETALNELAQSIEKYGLIQPIVVYKSGDGYTLIAGERRLRATKLLGHQYINAVVADIADKGLRELALIENIQRENLSPIELATSYKELIDEYKITQEDLAELVKKSRAQVANTLRLLSLDSTTQKLIDDGKISQGHAKIMVSLVPEMQRVVADSIIGQRLSVRETENLIKRLKSSKKEPKQTQNIKIPSGLAQIKEIFNTLGVKCKINKDGVLLELGKTDQIEHFINLIKQIK